MFSTYKESNYERAVMELFGGLGYQTLYAPDIERDFQSPLYDEILEEQILKLNPTLPQEAIDNAIYKLKKFVKMYSEIFSLETLRVDATSLLRYIF